MKRIQNDQIRRISFVQEVLKSDSITVVPCGSHKKDVVKDAVQIDAVGLMLAG